MHESDRITKTCWFMYWPNSVTQVEFSEVEFEFIWFFHVNVFIHVSYLWIESWFQKIFVSKRFWFVDIVHTLDHSLDLCLTDLDTMVERSFCDYWRSFCDWLRLIATLNLRQAATIEVLEVLSRFLFNLLLLLSRLLFNLFNLLECQIGKSKNRYS